MPVVSVEVVTKKGHQKTIGLYGENPDSHLDTVINAVKKRGGVVVGLNEIAEEDFGALRANGARRISTTK